MSGKTKGPKLHAVKPKECTEQHEHGYYSRGEDVIDALLDSDFLDELLGSGLFDTDGDRDTELEAHRVTTDSQGNARLAIGSPHGGPVFMLSIGELSESAAENIRLCLAAEHTECYAGVE